MRILQVNKFHFPKGGADIYYLDVGKRLQNRGHEVAYFSTDHPENVEGGRGVGFPSFVDTESPILSYKGLRVAFKLLRNKEAEKALKKTIHTFCPDVAHIHNIYHHFGPTILGILHDEGVPVVMTVHDYKMLSPNYRLFAHGAILPPVRGVGVFRAVKERWVKNSYLCSALCALEHFLYEKAYQNYIQRYIAPSEYVQKKLAAHGVSKSKIEIVPHYIDPVPIQKNDQQERVLLYVGRLSEEKGVHVLFRALPYLPKSVKILVVGDGPERRRLETWVAEHHEQSRVRIIGYNPRESLTKYFQQAYMTIVPSVWEEVMPFAAIESLGHGVPVIASQIGGLSDVVEEGKTGYLFPAGDELALAEKIFMLLERPNTRKAMRTQARLVTESLYHPEQHLTTLENIYSYVL